MSAAGPLPGAGMPARHAVARSMLFVPSTSDRKIDKACASPADAVILDLEDAVAIAEKPAARRLLRDIVGVPRRLPAWVRINAMSTPFCLQDVIATTIPGMAGIILPKAESAEEIRRIDWLMSQVEIETGLAVGSVGLMAIVETSRGLVNVDAIAAASPRLVRLLYGAVDLAADMTIDIDDASGASGHARFAIARASAAAGLQAPLDTAFADFANLTELRATSQRAKGLGFGGKSCIHPTQVPVVNEVFAPSAREIAWAERVVAAFAEAEARGQGAVQIDGEMIDYPVVYRAQRILGARAGA
ncbi:MAG: CoA ester lyase [Lautropia sp.]